MTTARMARTVFREGAYRLVKRTDRLSLTIEATVYGKRYRISTGETSLPRAQRKLADFMAEVESGYKPKLLVGADEWQLLATALTARARWRAKTRGIPFMLNAPFVYGLMKQAEFRCSISGIAFAKPDRKALEREPWAPSIDRIDPRVGYLRDNVRMVALAANYAMNQWGYDVLLRLSLAVARNANLARPEEEFTAGLVALPPPERYLND